MSLLEMRNIKKSFDGTEVLKGYSLTVEKGEVLGIIGPRAPGNPRCFDARQTWKSRIPARYIMREPLAWCSRTLIFFPTIPL